MAKFQSIEIDFEVHREIEKLRHGFDDTANDVLRRVFELPEKHEDPVPSSAEKRYGWEDDGVRLPNGTEAEITYNKQTGRAEIRNGRWVVAGQGFLSPSDAASAAVRTRKGTRPSLNGWIYWRVKRPGDDSFVLLNELRNAADK